MTLYALPSLFPLCGTMSVEGSAPRSRCCPDIVEEEEEELASLEAPWVAPTPMWSGTCYQAHHEKRPWRFCKAVVACIPLA
jgi:hypothetical protein